MSKKLAFVFSGIITVFTVSCSSSITGSQDVGDIDRTQPDKIQGIWDTPSDPDQTVSLNVDEDYQQVDSSEGYGDGIEDGDRW